MKYQSAPVIETKVTQLLSGKWHPDKYFLGFADSKYYCPTLSEVNTYLKHNHYLIAGQVKNESYDCDDFAYALRGNIGLYSRNAQEHEQGWALGIIWGRFRWIDEQHAANWVYTRDKGCLLLEPQNGKLYDFDQCLGNVNLVLM